MPALAELTTEYKADPLGMDEPRPRFAYKLTGTRAMQSARRVVVRGESGRTMWDSGWVESGESIQIPYEGEPLQPFTRYTWRAEARLGEGETAVGGEAAFETGFLGTEWNAGKWIYAPSGQGNYRPAARMAREFDLTKPLKRARLYATALGVYTPFINGKPASEDWFAPGWTQYEDRVQYQAYDVTKLLTRGANVVAALVGDGWFCGTISYVGMPDNECGWGRYPLFRAELRIEYADGTIETIGTDKSWSSFYLDPALLNNDFYLGEEYDAMFDDTAWKLPGFKTHASSVGGVQEKDWPAPIIWNDGAPVRVIRELRPVAITRRPSGTYLLDFGENVAGVERLTLKGAHPGAVITVRHGEALDADGNLWRDNLAFAKAMTVLTCGREPWLVYTPSFTYYGFRYAEVSGWPEEMTPDSVVVLVLSSVGARTGHFSCSNEFVNQLFDNVIRSQEGNFIDVPTDCPQRCERFGWTGDAQIFAETAMMNFAVPEFFTKWIADVTAAREPSGAFPSVAPKPPSESGMREKAGRRAGEKNGTAKSGGSGSAGWSDAGVVCPWMLYRKYGDTRILEREFEAIFGYVALLDASDKLGTIGDHLNLDAPTSGHFITQALRIEMMRLAGLIAARIGRDEVGRCLAAQRKARLGEFHATFFTPEGELTERTQTAAAMTIVYGLAPDARARELARKLLVADIVGRGTHLSTGFLGTPLLLRALTEVDELELAYGLLEQIEYPSWLYPVTQGATSIWERWNAIVDGKFHESWMNSLNHYAYGSVAAWFYETIAGIRDVAEEDPAGRGWKHFRLAPRPGGTLTHAGASFVSPYGTIESAWKRRDNLLNWRFTVPPNTTAEIRFPGATPADLPEGLIRQGDKIIARPGNYVFTGLVL
jgi:alpha-L-rhamnosidase